MSRREALSKLPKVDRVLGAAALADHPVLRRIQRVKVQEALAQLRERLLAGADGASAGEGEGEVEVPTAEALAETIAGRLDAMIEARPRRALNATGVVLHTNLGRAPMGGEVVEAIVAAAGACDLELDLATGLRGSRYAHLCPLLAALVGAEDAHVVGNGAAALLIACTALGGPGGVALSRGQMIEIGDAAGRLRVFDLGWDLTNAYGLWAGLLGGLFVTLGSHGVDQMMVQRYLCARRLADARRALWVGGFVIVAQFALFLLIGVGLFAFYELFPPEVAFERPDRVFARFLLDEMPVGLLGLLLGAVFAAAMSTLSSSLNSCATAVTNDLYRDRLGDSATPESLLRLTRRWTIVFGLAQIGVGIGGQWVQASVVSSVLGIAAFTTGIVLGVFFLGLWADRVGQRAALVGLVCGLVGMTFVFFGTPLAWPWYALVGSLGTFAIGWGASYWFPRERPGLG